MTLRVKDGSNIRYFIVNSVEARHKEYSFNALGKTSHYHQASILVNGECLWVESCEVGDIKAHARIVALRDIIVDTLVSHMEAACLLSWRDILRAAAKEVDE